MKRRFWLTTFLLISGWQPISRTIQPVALDSAILRLVDGTQAICIEQIFSYAQNLIMLLNGAKSLDIAQKLALVYDFPLPFPLTAYSSGPDKFGLIPFKNTYKTIQELIELEKTMGEMDAALKESFKYLKIDFEKLSIEYLEDLQKGKQLMMPLIKNWSILRNREDSILLEWSQIENNEKETLTKRLTKFTVSGRLIEDLLLFLSDLVQNCPKSHRSYREALKKTK
ncbi:TPA: hypothetical protein DCW54_00890 [Candidatus Dependentiae bacterium]|nr:hypothetical protein [Candidatus Dependentiae bacterium]